MALCACSSEGAAQQADALAIDEAGAGEALLLRVADKAIAARHELALVWPGFWPADQAFALWPFEGGSLVVAPTPPIPSAVRPLTGAAVPPSLRGIVYFYADPRVRGREQHFEAEHRIGDRVVPGVGTLPPGTTFPRELVQVMYLFHEAFHGHQDSAFAGRDGFVALEEPFIDPGVVTDPDFRARMAVERRILVDALGTDDLDRVRSLASDYLAVRGLRLAGLPARSSAEQLVERKEASAELVGWQAALVADDAQPDRLAEVLRQNLPQPILEENVRVVDRYRNQLYATGAAIGAILDMLNVDWRQAMERGASFPELLADAVDSAWPDARPDDAVLARYDHAGLRARFAQYERAEPLADLRTYSGPRLVVRWITMMSRQYSGGRSAPSADVNVYLHGTTLDVSGRGVHIESRGNQVLERDSIGRTAYTLLLDELPLVNDAAAEAGPRRYGSVRLEGETVIVTIERPVVVTREGETLTIEIE